MKYKITADEHGALPDGLKGEYTQQADGSFALKLDDDPVREYRTNNIAARQQLDALNAQLAQATTQLKAFEGVDPEKYKQLTQAADTAGVKDPKDLAGIVEVVKGLQTQVATLTADITTRDQQVAAERERANQVALRGDLRRKLVAQGVHDVGSAPEVAVDRIIQHYELAEDGRTARIKATAFDPQTGNTLTLEGLVTSLRKQEPYLFKSSTGAPGDPFRQPGGGGDLPTDVQQPIVVGGKKVLVKPNPRTLQHFEKQIASGEIEWRNEMPPH